MSTYRRWQQALAAALMLVIVVAAWIFLAPIQVGGQASYAIINGNSMEPHFHLGDLVIARQRPDYQVGDIVVYQNAQLRGLVFHRIIGLDSGQFVMKGDHNGWVDSYEPSPAEVVGELWVYVPNGGNIIRWLRSPIVLTILASILGVYLGIILTTRNKHGKKMKEKSASNWSNSLRNWAYQNLVARFKRSPSAKDSGLKLSKPELLPTAPDKKAPLRPEDKNSQDLSGLVEIGLFGLGLMALAALALGLVAFFSPLTRTVANNSPYQQTGIYSYSATAPSGIYDSSHISPSQPLFPALNCLVKLDFKYVLLGNGLQGLSGTHQLTASIQEQQSGWQRSLALEPATAFKGNTFATTSSIDLCQVEAMVATMEKATNLHSAIYSLFIYPTVSITGQMGGRKLQDTYNAPLVFTFDIVHFYLFKSDTVPDPLNQSQAGLVTGTRVQANTLSLFGWKPDVAKTRQVTAIVFGLSLAGLILLWVLVSRKVRGSQAALFQMKYAAMLVDVQQRALELVAPAVDVVTMDDLAKLAEKYNGVILHEARGLLHYYFVEGDRMLYRFQLNDGGDGSLESQPRQLQENLLQGLERGEFQVYYQPIFSVPDGRITAVEALLRWQHPERGLVPAREFIFAAEQTGLIDRIGEWMLQAACAKFMQWQKAGIRVKLAVNLSERQLENEPADFIARVLHKTGMDPQTLQIEIPAASLAGKAPNILLNLQKLSQLGIQISVDGFAGQSPLSSLEQFQINSVKIDRHVVGRIGDPKNALTVSGMISAVRSLGLNVVAEGVETEEQMEFLRSHLCTLAQGYFLGRPVPADEVAMLLEQDRRPDRPGQAA